MGRRRRESREKELEGVNLLGLAPRRIAEWEEVDGKLVLLRPPPSSAGLKGALDRFFHKMSASRIRLDEVGAFAWLHLDGERTVGEVGELMRNEFGELVEPMEERLGHFVWVMRKEGFLIYRDWDDAP
ncbi:MAG: PqqD family protein [Gemmatimonadetes bacterium]|nr:PqqD family protein [Gemmatimonadota bacterium]NNM03908.1 PqqD family protein [Gemmatimonadota bacterium]